MHKGRFPQRCASKWPYKELFSPGGSQHPLFPGTLLSLHIYLEKWFSVAKIKEIHSENCFVESEPIPIEAMYGIFTYIYYKDQLNVGKYTIKYHTWMLWDRDNF